MFEPVMQKGTVKRCGRGQPRLRPTRLVGKKGYSSGATRLYLTRRGIWPTIPRRRDEMRLGPFDRRTYRRCNKVERCINRLKQYRRVCYTRFSSQSGRLAG